jgi:hypothetical protein
MSTTLHKKDDITASVSNFLGSIHQKLGESKSLHDLGVNDELASYVHDFFSDPLKGLIESNNASLNGLKKMVQNLITRFLGSQKDKINKAFHVEADAQLVYYICIKDDKTENREPYFEFIEFYEELGLKNRLPLYIKFVPERVLHRVELEEMSL